MTRRFLMAFVTLALAAGLAACAAGAGLPPLPEPAPIPSEGPARTVYVTSTGWHTGIVIARADLPRDQIPEAADFPSARFLEFGWGDAEYYPAEDPTAAMALRAVLEPTPAVMHVAGLNVEPARRYPKAEVVALTLDGAGLIRLIRFIDGSFERAGQARAASRGRGLYADSFFYPAVGRFHLFNTCNTWSARALRAGGLPVHEAETTRAEDLMRQLRPLSVSR